MVGWVSSILSRSYPFGTLAVNVAGSFMIGLSYVLVVDRLQSNPQWQAILMVGFIGAFTTFSTFSLETLVLLQAGRVMAALSYILVSVIVCILVVALGMWLARQMFL